MKREIKFRAINKQGVWVYGYLSKDAFGTYYITSIDGVDTWEVDPETVGQFTGLKFNDLDLYEDDIIEWYQKPEGYPNDPNLIRKTKVIKIDSLIGGCFLFNFYDYKIIGNIHQNPELLK